MKLYQKIMALIFVILAGCGILCGRTLGRIYEKRQMVRAAEAKVQSFEGAKYMMEWTCQREPAAGESGGVMKLVLERLFSQSMFDGYLWLKNGEAVCDSSRYEISWNPEWKTEGRFEKTEYVLEQDGEDYWVVIGSRLPWLGEEDYLFLVQDMTKVHAEARELLRQFSVIWLFFIAAASLLGAAAAKLVLWPVGKLAQAARSISRGDYDVRIEVKRRDETGELAEAFRIMAEQVENRIKELTLAGEEKERLLGCLAHEMRTPMTSIMGYSDTLLHVKLGEREKERALQNIYEQAGYLQRLSAKLMELVALHQNVSISMETHQAGELLERAVFMAEKRWPDRRFHLDIQEACFLYGDGDLLVSLFVNLMDNGAKASRPGQEVQILVRKDQVAIRDFGKGMEEEELSKIKEPFYRKGGEGLGLGLAVCEQIARLHDAKLQFKSRKGEGTAVTVSFYKRFTGR